MQSSGRQLRRQGHPKREKEKKNGGNGSEEDKAGVGADKMDENHGLITLAAYDKNSSSAPTAAPTIGASTDTTATNSTGADESLFNDPTSSNTQNISTNSSNETDATTAVIDQDIESEGGGDPNAYEPGNLQTLKNGILLSKGLDCRIIAETGKSVPGAESTDKFHGRPDFGATFPTDNGGWVYVSNSEVKKKKGGVGAIYFDKNSKVIDYKMLLKKTSMNCGGGKLLYHIMPFFFVDLICVYEIFLQDLTCPLPPSFIFDQGARLGILG